MLSMLGAGAYRRPIENYIRADNITLPDWQHASNRSTTEDLQDSQAHRRRPVVAAAIIGTSSISQHRHRRPRSATSFAKTTVVRLPRLTVPSPDGVTVFEDEYTGVANPRPPSGPGPPRSSDSCH